MWHIENRALESRRWRLFHIFGIFQIFCLITWGLNSNILCITWCNEVWFLTIVQVILTSGMPLLLKFSWPKIKFSCHTSPRCIHSSNTSGVGARSTGYRPYLTSSHFSSILFRISCCLISVYLLHIFTFSLYVLKFPPCLWWGGLLISKLR